MIKKIGYILASLIGLLAILYFVFTGPVDQTPYFEADYYKESCSKIDSLKKHTSTVYDSVKAGFAKVSITPHLGASEDDIQNGKFQQVPLEVLHLER